MIISIHKKSQIKIVGAILQIKDESCECEIDLLASYASWLKDKNLAIDGSRPKGIGERDICAKPPYFELWGSTKTRIECNNPKGCFDFITKRKSKDDISQFTKLQYLLNQNGFTTLDLS